MANLSEIVRWCDQFLQSQQFKDYCPNGLQIEGKAEVETVVSSVTASLQAIEQALDVKADMLLVHHGYFWKGEPAPLTGIKGRRIKQLMQADISLLAYHLPLDAHPEIGNNACLAQRLGIEITGALNPQDHFPIGNIGRLAQPMTAQQFAQLLTERLGQTPICISTQQRPIQKIGFCTGAAQDFLSQAAMQGCDAYLSGEVSERTFHEAQEYGIHYFAAGHHATERYGVQSLAERLVQQFHLKHRYVELDNPI